MTFRVRNVLFGLACAGTAGLGCSGPAKTNAFPETCKEVQENVVDETGNRPDDGTYTLYAEGKEIQPWNAYCNNMSRSEPSEYVTVVKASNFSQVANGSTFATTSFSRLRIDPDKLELWPLDVEFASTVDDDDLLGSTGFPALDDLPAGTAFYLAPGAAAGGAAEASLDLSGSGFEFDESIDDDGFIGTEVGTCLVVVGGCDESETDTGDLTSLTLTALNNEANVSSGVSVDFDNMTTAMAATDPAVDSVTIPLVWTGVKKDQ